MCRQWVLHPPPILLKWPRDPSSSGEVLRILGRHPCPLEAESYQDTAHSVVSDSLQPHGLYLARLLSPWNFPGKNTGLGCHFLLQGIFLTWDQTWVSHVPCITRWILYHWAIWEAPTAAEVSYYFIRGTLRKYILDQTAQSAICELSFISLQWDKPRN